MSHSKPNARNDLASGTHRTKDRETFVSVASRGLAHIPKVVSALATLVPLVYAVGWVYSFTYFDEFGARWLMDEIGLVAVTHRALDGVNLFLLVLVVTTISDLDDVAKDADETRVLRWLHSGVRFNIGLMFVLAALVALAVLTGWNKAPAAVLTLFTLCFYFLAMFLAAHVLIERWRGKTWNSPDVLWSVVLLGLFVVVGIPMMRAHVHAQRDKMPAESRLPFIELKEPHAGNFQMLLKTGSEVYAVDLAEDRDAYLLIRVFSSSEVAGFRGSRGDSDNANLTKGESKEN